MALRRKLSSESDMPLRDLLGADEGEISDPRTKALAPTVRHPVSDDVHQNRR